MLFAVTFDPSTWTTPAAVAAVTLVLLLRLRARSRRSHDGGNRPTSPTVVASSKFGGAIPAASQRPGERQLVEFYEFAREIEARLDAKRAALERLIGEADERIERLNASANDEPTDDARAA